MRLSLVQRTGGLPFHPMALGAIKSMKQIFESPPTSAARKKSLLELPVQERTEFDSPLLFASPKHDGIRLITFTEDRSKEDLAKKSKRTKTQQSSNIDPMVTCYSRFGRPLRGLFWIERELKLLRELSGDPHLSLDGELYIHSNALSDATAAIKPPYPWELNGTDGFSLVSGLLQRFRGNRHKLPKTRQELLKVTPIIPNYRLFDIISYTPSPEILSGDHSVRVKNVREAALAESQTPSMSCLSVSPNHTPFVQRLRTLNFLLSLLRHHQKIYPTTTRFIESVTYKSIPSIAASQLVLKEFTDSGFEGAVIRTSLNRYHATPRKSGSKGGFRSTSAVKLLPLIEDEFVVLNIIGTSAFAGLECSTKAGSTFRVPFTSVTSDKAAIDITVMQKLRGNRSAYRFVVGTFVTLQFQSRLPSGIPRFPRIKCIRGGAGWYL